MDYKAEQEMELEALQAILMEDLEGKTEQHTDGEYYYISN